MKNFNGFSLPIALAVGDVRGYCVLSNHCHIQILDVSHDLPNGFVSGLSFSSPVASIYANLFEQAEVLTKRNAESGMLDFGSIQMIGIRNLLSTDMIRSPESSTWNQESLAWNPESKTILGFLIWGRQEKSSSSTGFVWNTSIAAASLLAFGKLIRPPFHSFGRPIWPPFHYFETPK